MIILATALVAITSTPRIVASENLTIIPNQANAMEVCQQLADDYIRKTKEERERVGLVHSLEPIARCIGS